MGNNGIMESNETIFGFVDYVQNIEISGNYLVAFLKGGRKIYAPICKNLPKDPRFIDTDVIKLHLTPVIGRLDDLRELRDNSLVTLSEDCHKDVSGKVSSLNPQGDFPARFCSINDGNYSDSPFHAGITNGYHSLPRIYGNLRNHAIERPVFQVRFFPDCHEPN